MSKGAWGAALSGLGEGLQRAAPMIYNSWREEEARKWQSVRDEYLAELRHKYSMAELGEREQMAIRAEDRQRAPYQRAAQATTSLINSAARLDEDAAGNITRTRAPSPALRSRRASGLVRTRTRVCMMPRAACAPGGQPVRDYAAAQRRSALPRRTGAPARGRR